MMKNFDFVILKTQQHLMREWFLSAINIKYKNVCMNLYITWSTTLWYKHSNYKKYEKIIRKFDREIVSDIFHVLCCVTTIVNWLIISGWFFRTNF